MMLTIKLTGKKSARFFNFQGCVDLTQETGSAFEYYDGNVADTSLLSKDQQARSFKQLPSLFEWLGVLNSFQCPPYPSHFFPLAYCFFFPTFLVGPPCGLKEYLTFSDRSMFAKEAGGKIPSPMSWAGESLFNRFRENVSSSIPGLGCKLSMSAVALVYHFVHAKFNVLFAASPEIWNYPFYFRFAYLILATELSFEHYYFGWSFAEGACVLTGLAYNGRNAEGNVVWNRVDMVDLWALSKEATFYVAISFHSTIESLSLGTAQNGAVVGRAWNVLGARWLRSTVYMRLCDRNSSPVRRNLAQVATFMTSAFWHGFCTCFALSIYVLVTIP